MGQATFLADASTSPAAASSIPTPTSQLEEKNGDILNFPARGGPTPLPLPFTTETDGPAGRERVELSTAFC